MPLIAGATVWILFASFILFPMLELPAALQRAVVTLLVVQFLVIGVAHYGGPGLSAAAWDAASIDVPVLALALFVVGIMRSMRALRQPSR